MQQSGSQGFFGKLATATVDKRKIILFLYIIALAFCVVSRGWVQVCDDLTAYLPADTETRRGLTVMEDEFVTYGTARVMISQTTYDRADRLAEELRGIEGVFSVEFDDTADHWKGTDVLFDVTFNGPETDESVLAAMDAVRAAVAPYDAYISTTIGVSMADTLDSEMQIILLIAAVIIVVVLLLTSRSYAEVPVLILTFAAAALLNMGTNFLCGEISFVSNSVSVVLQLALAIDYAIILLHRFTEERRTHADREACILALAASIPAIASSSLTTISGLAAMMFMQFRIGFDLGLVLIKAICFSMLSVFTLMPALLMLFAPLLEKTVHRELIPRIDAWGRFAVRLRFVGAPLFVALAVVGFFLSSDCPFAYGETLLKTFRQNDTQIAQQRIDDTFGTQNIMALLVPKGNHDAEAQLLDTLESYPEVDYAMGLANIEAIGGYVLTDELTPRELAEAADLDYSSTSAIYALYAAENDDLGNLASLDDYKLPLMDLLLFLCDKADSGAVTLDADMQANLDDIQSQLKMAQDQMQGTNYDRIVLALTLPEEGEDTFDFLQTIHKEAAKYYGPDAVLLVGNSTSDYDLATTFAQDNVLISVLSAVFVIIVLLYTFQSAGLPLLLILVIQGSIWLNFSVPALTGDYVFFMSYLIVTAIQMGANIDYAIVVSTRYSDCKKQMPPKQAIVAALNLAFPTILTSGSILTSAAFLIGCITTQPYIAGIGECLCRGTLISIFLVLFILPQILVLGDAIVERTRFILRLPSPSKQEVHGAVLHVDGHVRGYIHGYVDGTLHGTIRGDATLQMATGQMQTLPPTIDPPPESAAAAHPDTQEGTSDETTD